MLCAISTQCYLLAIGYTCVVGWIFKYTFLSFTGDLFSMGQDMDVINGTLSIRCVKSNGCSDFVTGFSIMPIVPPVYIIRIFGFAIEAIFF